ncbi:DEAD/DEAH box helicase [Patescibacteria group bacterium]
MYRHSGRSRPKRNQHRARRHNGGGRGGYRIRTFDPSRIVANASEIVEEDTYEAKYSFSDFDISGKLKANIAGRGYTSPTPIQDQTIPEIIKGTDIVGIANTGTGKTGAFLIPLLDEVLRNRDQRVLVIIPTRELAVQIERELILFSKGLGIRSVVCIGGVSDRGQIDKLRRNPSFVIGTPGRLLDLENQRAIRFDKYNTLVLDEVDRMLDMGFINDMKKIVHSTPRNRQSLFFSATLRVEVLEIMKQFTTDPMHISVKSSDSLANVNQEILKVNGRSKYETLRDLLDKREFEKVLIFGRTKRGVEKLAKTLSRDKYLVSAIHGNKSQNQRQRSLDTFKQGGVNILVATDVVARGIDVEDISHVINYELPETYEDYHHRIGRTGRAGKMGKAITFIN